MPDVDKIRITFFWKEQSYNGMNIDEIQMDANGLGVMSVANGEGELTELHTKNLGKTWKKATRMIN